MRIKILGAISLLALLAASFAYGQQTQLRVNVSFQFSVKGKELPAGEYIFSKDSGGQAINIAGDGKLPIRVPIITRLAAGRHTTPKDAHLVFDKVGDTHYFSEIWFPGEDGFMLRSTKEKHEHEIVDVPR